MTFDARDREVIDRPLEAAHGKVRAVGIADNREAQDTALRKSPLFDRQRHSEYLSRIDGNSK